MTDLDDLPFDQYVYPGTIEVMIDALLRPPAAGSRVAIRDAHPEHGGTYEADVVHVEIDGQPAPPIPGSFTLVLSITDEDRDALGFDCCARSHGTVPMIGGRFDDLDQNADELPLIVVDSREWNP